MVDERGMIDVVVDESMILYSSVRSPVLPGRAGIAGHPPGINEQALAEYTPSLIAPG